MGFFCEVGSCYTYLTLWSSVTYACGLLHTTPFSVGAYLKATLINIHSNVQNVLFHQHQTGGYQEQGYLLNIH